MFTPVIGIVFAGLGELYGGGAPATVEASSWRWASTGAPMLAVAAACSPWTNATAAGPATTSSNVRALASTESTIPGKKTRTTKPRPDWAVRSVTAMAVACDRGAPVPVPASEAPVDASVGLFAARKSLTCTPDRLRDGEQWASQAVVAAFALPALKIVSATAGFNGPAALN